MADYRVYFLDDFNQHIVGARQIEAPDDAAAVSMAERMRGLSPLELWCDERKIRQWDACSRTTRSPR
jgi:hypothetical protein